MKATEDLKQEHEGILLMLNIMEQISAMNEPNIVHLAQIIDFIKTFADKCHHGKEEDLLFPKLIEKGIRKENGPIGVMLYEHEQGRKHIKDLSVSFENYKNGDKSAISGIKENLNKYIDLLRNHISKENNVLFKMADEVLSEKEQDSLFEEFEKIEIERIGIGKHEEYHQLLKLLKKEYLP
jgi:hemerythrin-like domain-containing protein